MSRKIVVALCLLGGVVSAGPFEDWDRDHDQRLAREELPEGLRPHFDRLDTDRDGFISRAEHEAFLSRRKLSQPQRAQPVPEQVELIRNIDYAGAGNPKQTLDLILPRGRAGGKLPLIVFIHGGAWLGGDKKSGHGSVMPFVRDGRYAGASVEYRFSQEATWPAQIFDCKAAIRWLRGNAAKYGIDPDRIAVWGGSAGGHLVAMLGTSGDVRELEGGLGSFTKESSRVQAVIDFFGPADFPAITNAPSSLRHGDADSPEAKLIGGRIADKPEVARQVSPVTFATRDDPPFLIAHGTKDMTVPFSQSEAMTKALRDAGVAVPPVFIPMTGAGHGFRSEELNRRIAQFLDLHLYGVKADISSDPIDVAGR